MLLWYFLIILAYVLYMLLSDVHVFAIILLFFTSFTLNCCFSNYFGYIIIDKKNTIATKQSSCHSASLINVPYHIKCTITLTKKGATFRLCTYIGPTLAGDNVPDEAKVYTFFKKH